MIKFENVFVKYGSIPVLSNVNVSIGKGDFVYLAGQSGAGKSSFLKLIYMDILPESGIVHVAGFRSDTIKKKQVPLLRRQLGIVFQDFRLLRDRNVYDNIAFALFVTGTRRKDVVRKKVLKVLSDVGLSHKRHKMPYELSGGEQQRVVIARALINEPFVILADEPTGNLDFENSQEIMKLIMQINENGTAVLMATHDQQVVAKYQKRVLRIENGQISDE